MSDLALEVEEQYYNDSALDCEQAAYEEALYRIEEFKATVKNEDEYVDLILAEEKIAERQEIYVNYQHNSIDELKTKIDSLENIIIDIAKKLTEQSSSIPITDKKMITVKDFEELYSIGEEAQRKLRKRIRDPLPFVQIVERGSILYDCMEIGKWLENYKK